MRAKMSNQIRVYLNESDYQVLKDMSERHQIPVAVLGRTAVVEYLRNQSNNDLVT